MKLDTLYLFEILIPLKRKSGSCTQECCHI
nr:MAG TPA: hypothetical protein [Caudoviricetes sp.]